MKPESNPESTEPSSQDLELEMKKRVVKMPDGKRDIIYFTFEVKHVRAQG